jgi:hypothetical protein
MPQAGLLLTNVTNVSETAHPAAMLAAFVEQNIQPTRLKLEACSAALVQSCAQLPVIAGPKPVATVSSIR